MKIVIEIPKEFMKDYKENKFKDFFDRVISDITCTECLLCGNYERETAEMFLNAFQHSESAGYFERKSYNAGIVDVVDKMFEEDKEVTKEQAVKVGRKIWKWE